MLTFPINNYPQKQHYFQGDRFGFTWTINLKVAQEVNGEESRRRQAEEEHLEWNCKMKGEIRKQRNMKRAPTEPRQKQKSCNKEETAKLRWETFHLYRSSSLLLFSQMGMSLDYWLLNILQVATSLHTWAELTHPLATAPLDPSIFPINWPGSFVVFF